VYSASAASFAETSGGVVTLLIKQAIFVAISIVTIIFFAKLDYHIYAKIGKPIIIVAVISLALVLIFGEVVNGARRRLDLGIFTIQPVELVKFAVVLYFSALLVKKQQVIKSFENGFVPFMV